MKNGVSKLLLAAVLTQFAGCATSEIHWDATKMREHALDYYTEEIIDNLIRARNGLVFVHVDVTDLTANVQSELAGTVGGGQTLNNTSTTSATAAMSSVVRAAMRPITFSISPKRSDTLISDTKPEVNDPEVYKPYLQFLKLQSPGQRLQSITNYDLKFDKEIQSIRIKQDGQSLTEGGNCIPGTIKTWHGQTYYVPIEFKQAYFDLCLALIGRIEAAGGPSRTTKKQTGKSPITKPSSASDHAKFIPLKDASRELRQLEFNEEKLNQLRSMRSQ